MVSKQRTFIYKLLAVVFILLLLTPCTIKSDIKVSLNISTSTTNKDRLTTSACSIFSTNKRQSQEIGHNSVLKKDSEKLLERDASILVCSKTLDLENRSVQDDVYFYTVPIFIHFRELII